MLRGLSIVVLLPVLLFGLSFMAGAADGAIADHVLLIGLDGARPDILQVPGLHYIPELIAGGTSIWKGQAVDPTITEVNWAAMLTGSKPVNTGITRQFASQAELDHTRLQAKTIFEVLAEHGKSSSGYLGHWKLYTLDTGAPGPYIMRSPYSSTQAARAASLRISLEKPSFAFVHMGDLDGLGHNHGWMSDEQIAGMPKIDLAIGQLLHALERGGMRGRTIVMISSDHGGTGKRHTLGTPEDRTIPWVISGPGVREGYVLDREVPIYDIAATVLYALGVPVPSEWDGTPLLDIFE